MTSTIRLVIDKWKSLTIAILLLVCIIQTTVIIHQVPSQLKINLSDSSCNYSRNIGKRIFFHKCVKENQIVYDLRYFYLENKTLKADITGFQLDRKQFGNLCEQCYI